MQNWIVALIVFLAVIYLVRRFRRSLKRGTTPGCGCSDTCSGCQASATCDSPPEERDG
jgi:hypothetical protein